MSDDKRISSRAQIKRGATLVPGAGRDRAMEDAAVSPLVAMSTIADRCRLTIAAAIPIAVSLVVACSSFDPSAPYTLFGGAAEEHIEIPEGTRIIEHPPVSIESRRQRIELGEDLVLTRGAEPLYRIGAVDTDIRGNIFVHDGGNQNVVVFDADGGYLGNLGRPGQGPGELGTGGDFGAADGAVAHVLRNRINIWSADGALQASRNVPFTTRLSSIKGAGEDRFVAFARRRRTGTGFRQEVVAIDADGYTFVTYADLPRHLALGLMQGNRTINTRLPRPRPSFAVSRTGDVYVTTGAHYEVLALAADGTPRWALTVAWPQRRLTDERIDQALDHVAGRDDELDNLRFSFPDVRRSDVDWPEFLPALSGTGVHRREPIRVDGHGHLYVFPFIPDAWDRPEQPVDVYSADGEHLFSGMIPMNHWGSARGDYVYGVRRDPDTEESVAVRYRLVEPFD